MPNENYLLDELNIGEYSNPFVFDPFFEWLKNKTNLKKLEVRKPVVFSEYEQTTLNIGSVRIKLKEIYGMSLGVCGATGSGKTNTMAVILEEFTKYNIPFTIFDQNRDFISLRKKTGMWEHFKKVQAKKIDESKIEIQEFDKKFKRLKSIYIAPHTEEYIEELATHDFIGHPDRILKPVIYEESRTLSETAKKIIIQKYFLNIFKIGDQLYDAGKQACRAMVIDEFGSYCPQNILIREESYITNHFIDTMQKIAREGRKYGVFVIAGYQRPQDVNKKFLTQTQRFIIMRTTATTEQDIIKQYIKIVGEARREKVKAIMNSVPNLESGEFIPIIPGIHPKKEKCRMRYSEHGGITPTVDMARKNVKNITANDLGKYAKYVYGEKDTEKKKKYEVVDIDEDTDN